MPGSSSSPTSPTSTGAACGSTSTSRTSSPCTSRSRCGRSKRSGNCRPGRAGEEVVHALDVLTIIESVQENPGVIMAAQVERGQGRVDGGDEGGRRRVRGADGAARARSRHRSRTGTGSTTASTSSGPSIHGSAPTTSSRSRSSASCTSGSMTFSEYVTHYGLKRSEGVLLRYLSDVYKGLVQNIAEERRTDEHRRSDRLARCGRPPGRLQPDRRVGAPPRTRPTTIEELQRPGPAQDERSVVDDDASVPRDGAQPGLRLGPAARAPDAATTRSATSTGSLRRSRRTGTSSTRS